jgi:DNA ligase D-like protein (predicted ligase)
VATPKVKAKFIEPMLLLRSPELPDDEGWLKEIKLDGYRCLAIKTGGKVEIRSRNDNDFSDRYPAITKALAKMPDETVIDGEVVALDETGHPSFQMLQNYGSSKGPLLYFTFDVVTLAGKDVTGEPLETRRKLLGEKVLSKLAEPIRFSPALTGTMAELIHAVKAQGFEGLVAKRRDSKYEPGLRSGAWRNMRVNQGQELVIAGYTPSANNFDALIIGYYDKGKLIYSARTRNGFTPASRSELFKKLKPLEIKECPFSNLPEAKSGRWGAGLTAAKMKDCRWLKPVLVGQFEFVEWTEENHLRHTSFVALRDDKKAEDIRREAD